MKTAAIIAEYNPFHNGHLYQIEETRRRTGADFILVVMSGDFVQRGAPAFCNKYIRTQMALSCGADVVIELPACYALSSAEFFAGGAVTLLEQLHAVDVLSFGSEFGELSAITDCAHLLTTNSSLVHARLNEHLKSGCPYPAAMEKAVSELLTSSGSVLSNIHELFSSPNNILGLEYCKALYTIHSSIMPFTLKRQGSGYHDSAVLRNTPFLSASAIRRALSVFPPDAVSEIIREHVPEKVYDILAQNDLLTSPITENHFSTLLHYKLLSEQEKGFADYSDCSKDLSDKICKSIPHFTDFTGFCALLKSKDITYSHISRVLMHILLNIKRCPAVQDSLLNEHCPDTQGNLLSQHCPTPQRKGFFVPYARLLGFRTGGAPLLNLIKKNSEIPLLSKPADARFLLDKDAYELLRQDFFCASVYESVASPYRGKPFVNEIKQSPIIFP